MNQKAQQYLMELSTLPDLVEDEKYYRELLEGVNETIKGIEESIKDPNTFLVANGSNGINNWKYISGKLKIEKCQLLSDKNVYSNYLEQKVNSIKHAQQIEEEVTVECNRDFDVVFEKAKVQRVTNTDIRSVVDSTEGILDEILADQKKKNNLYLQILTYLK